MFNFNKIIGGRMGSKLAPCKACKKEVAISAERCTHCGEKDLIMTCNTICSWANNTISS